MKHFAKYLLTFMLAPAVVFGMEPERKKVCRYEPLSDAIEQCLSLARTSHTLEINGFLQVEVKELLHSVKQCTLLANRMRALPLHTVKLKSLLDDKALAIKGLKAITDVLSISPMLQRLELPGIWFARLGQERLCLIEGIIQHAPRLSALDLSDCHLTGLPVHDLSSFLRTLTQKRIDRLGLGGNNLGDNKPACQQVFNALRLMTHSLQSLGLRNNDLHKFSAADWHALGPVIGDLKELDLSYNSLGLRGGYFMPPMSDDSWRALLSELARSEIEKLVMKNNDLNEVSDVVWELFTHTIARMKNLKVLDLRGNWLKEISYERFGFLASSLLRHNGMTVVVHESDDPHGWFARLHGERGLNVVIKRSQGLFMAGFF